MLSELLLQNLCNLRNLRMMFSISDFSGKAVSRVTRPTSSKIGAVINNAGGIINLIRAALCLIALPLNKIGTPIPLIARVLNRIEATSTPPLPILVIGKAILITIGPSLTKIEANSIFLLRS